nr:transposon TX1 uncharacterized [Tanacetum cinerariifolium]
ARFDKWGISSKNLAKLLFSSMSSDEVYDLSTPSVFDPEPENREIKSLYERFVTAGSMHEVSPPITGTFMPTSYKSDLEETHATFGSKSNTSSINTSDSNDFVYYDNSEKSLASETYDFASCVSSTKTNDSFSTVDVKILPKFDVKYLSPTNGFPSCSFKENVKPPRNLCNKSGKANRIHCKNNFVRTKKCFICGNKSHLIKDCDVYDTVEDFPSVISKAASIPASSRNSQHLFLLVDPFLLLVEIDQHLFMLVDIFMLVHPYVNKDIGIVDSGCSPSMKRSLMILYRLKEVRLHLEVEMAVLRIPKRHDLYTFNLLDIQPEQHINYLLAKASLKKSTKWNRRMAHVNFKTINKLAKHGLVKVTDDFSRFSWAFFLGTKDETFYILKDIIALIEKQLNKKVKAIRCDNGTEFQNANLIALRGEKRIKMDYSNARTPQQNGDAKRKNRILDILRSLEANFSKFTQTNQFAGAVSAIPGIVQRYMDQRMNEAVKVVVQIQSDRLRNEAQRKNEEFLKTVDENMQKIIKEQLKFLPRSSHSSRTFYFVAADLSEMELKKIIIEKIEGNKSIQRSDKQRNLYKALVEAYKSDKIILDTYRETVTLKRRRDNDADKDEEPSAGPDRGLKRRREGKEPESASAPTKTATRSDGRSTQGSRFHRRRSCKSLVELEYHLEEVFKTTTDQLHWVNPEDQHNDLEYLRGGASSRHKTTLASDTLIDYQIKFSLSIGEIVTHWFTLIALSALRRFDNENMLSLMNLYLYLQVTPTKPGRMTKPYLSYRFIANCFNAGNLKMEVKIDSRTNLVTELTTLEHQNLKDLRQKAKFRWVVEGDENSRFFYGMTDPTSVKNRIVTSFESKFNEPNTSRPTSCSNLFKHLSLEQTQLLDQPFTLQEIKDAVWDYGGDKALSPDGFTFKLIIKYLDTFQTDIISSVKHFDTNGHIPRGCNSSFITLIPKIDDPLVIVDFRQISLIGCQYKSTAKVLANRFALVISSVVGEVQMTYIKGH